MSFFKEKSKPEAPRPVDKKGFSGFSETYLGRLNTRRMSYTEKMKRRNIIKWILIVIGLAALFTIAFIFTEVMLDISQKPVETTAARLFFVFRLSSAV